MPRNKVFIIKHSGQRELFSREKIFHSLQRAGAEAAIARDITQNIESRLRDGMTTEEIYRQAFSLLRKARRPLAARFSLKKAIFQLGPEGYPFEKFVGKLLERQGYKVQVGQIVQGKCVSHEVDIIAEKEDLPPTNSSDAAGISDDESRKALYSAFLEKPTTSKELVGGKHFLVECKFHNQQGLRSDVKVALYVKARFEDIQSELIEKGHREFHQAWLVTNTKFTQDAIQYARCVGMNIIGWSYPPSSGGGGSLQDLIEKSGLHPLTCMTALSSMQKRMLLQKGIVLCQEIVEKPALLAELGIKEDRQRQIVQEIKDICG